MRQPREATALRVLRASVDDAAGTGGNHRNMAPYVDEAGDRGHQAAAGIVEKEESIENQ